MAALVDLLPVPGADPSTVLDVFAAWADDGGRPLYSHQEEAALALTGRRTCRAGDADRLWEESGGRGSRYALALNSGRRAVWTTPIKALVAEKFFDLVDLLGAEQVGLATGDASINPARRCSCARQRCWRITRSRMAPRAASASHASTSSTTTPITIEAGPGRSRCSKMTNCQMLLASATLGDMTPIITDLRRRRSGRSVTAVTSVDRPTPLYHQWRMTSVADSVLEAVKEGLSPVYISPRQPGRSNRAGSSAGQHVGDHSCTAARNRRGFGR